MRHLVLALAMAGLGAGTALADPAHGLWQTERGSGGGYLHVQVAPCGTLVCGTIAGAFDDAGTPGPSYEHMGKNIIWDMEAQGNGAFAGGRIWAPDSGKTYRSKMQVSGNALKVSGCVGPICRSQTWTRVR